MLAPATSRDLQHKPAASAPQSTPGGGGVGAGVRASLRGQSFAAGEAMLAPRRVVQRSEAPAVPTTAAPPSAPAEEAPDTYFATDVEVPEKEEESEGFTLFEEEDDKGTLDLLAMSETAQKKLGELIGELDKDIAEKKAASEKASPQVCADLTQELNVLEQDKAAAEKSKAELGAAGAKVTAAELESAVRANDLEIEKVSKESTSTEVKLGEDGTLAATHTEVKASGDSGVATTEVSAEVGLDGTVKGTGKQAERHGDTTRTDSASVETNALGGTGSVSGSTNTTVKIGDQSTSEEISGQSSVAIDGGVKVDSSATHKTAVLDSEGAVKSSEEVTIGTSQGVVVSDGTGVTGGGSLGAKATNDGVTVGAKVGANGLFKVEVKPVAGDPPSYAIHLTLQAGGTLGGELGAKSEGKIQGAKATGDVGASGSVSGKATLELEHRLSSEEAKAYLDDLDKVGAGGEPATEYPEMSRLQQLIVAATDMDGAGAGALMGGAESARDMRDGDSVTLTLEGGISGSAKAGGTVAGFGANGEVKGSASYTRTLSMAKKGKALEVTIGFADASSLAGEGSVTFEGVTVGGGAGTSDKDAIKVAFLLDPESPGYEQALALIEGAMSPEDARALAKDPLLVQQVQSVTGATETADTSSKKIGVGAIEGSVSDTATRGETTSQGKEGSETTVTGTHQSDAKVGAGGFEVGSGRTDSMEVKVDEKGMSATVSEGQSGNDMAAGAEAEAEELGEADLAEKALGQAPLDRLKDVWNHMTTDLHGYNLVESDIETLAVRAGDKSKWSQCAAVVDLGLIEPWAALGRSLSSPAIDAAEAKADAALARRLALARALCDFAANHSRSTDVFEFALRRYGEDNKTYSTEKRLGTQFEWPAELADTKARYEKAVTTVAALPAALKPLASEPEGMGSANTKKQALIKELDAVKHALSAADLGAEARSEMLGTIAGEEGKIAVAWASFENDWDAAAPVRAKAGPGECKDEPADEAGASEAPLAAKSEAMSAPPRDPAKEGKKAQAKSFEEVCLRNHHAEQDLLRAAEETLLKKEGGRLANPEDVGYVEAAKSEWYHDIYDAIDRIGEVRKLDYDWVPKIVELKALYAAAGIPASEQVLENPTWVAQGIVLTPDVARLVRLYEGASSTIDDPQSIAKITSQWKAQLRW